MAVRQKLKKLACRTAKWYRDHPEECLKMKHPLEVTTAAFWESVYKPKRIRL